MPRAAGDYDPHPANFYESITEVASLYNREPKQTLRLFVRTFIRWPWPVRTDTEFIVQGQPQSIGQITCRVRRNSKTIRLDPSMTMVHDGTTYGIIGINRIPSTDRDELELLLQYKPTVTLVTS